MRKQQANALMKFSGVEGDSTQGKISQEPGRPDGWRVETAAASLEENITEG
jgi:hypothetical protein